MLLKRVIDARRPRSDVTVVSHAVTVYLEIPEAAIITRPDFLCMLGK
jgi:hypothetical protein